MDSDSANAFSEPIQKDASELVNPEDSLPVREGEGGTPAVNVISSELSPAVVTGADGEGEEDVVHEERDSVDSVDNGAVVVGEEELLDATKAERSESSSPPLVGGDMDREGIYCEKESILEENREEGGELVADEVIENNELGQSEKEKEARLNIEDIDIPDDNEVASVAGFTEIPSQYKGLDDSVLNTSGSDLVKEEFQIGEVGEAKEDVDEEEEKVDAVAVFEIETNKPQEVNDVSVDVSSAVEARNDKQMVTDDDVKENVDKDPDAGRSVDLHVPEAAQVEAAPGIDEEDNVIGGVGEAGQTVDLKENRQLFQEVDETKIVQASEGTETIIRDEDQKKDDEMTDVVEELETHVESSVAEIEEESEDMGKTEMSETQEENDETNTNEVSEETKITIGDEDQEKDDDMTDVERHGDTSVADIEEGRENREEMGMTETIQSQKETETEEIETRTEDEDQEKDDDMTDVAEDMEKHGDSSVADIEEGTDNTEETEGTEVTETQDDSAMADTGDEEPEEVDEENKSAGVKRKRVRNNTKALLKGTGKKKEEDVCFMCFDGGDLVLCDRRGCPKAYHPSCVNRDEAFFSSKDKWNCGWHLCSKCEKTATYLCYTCMFSLCKGCAKDAVFFCIRGNKGLCETCMETVKLIERKEQEKKEPTQLDFDDKTSWEYLFKDYWIDLKTQLSLSPEELDQAKSPRKGNECNASKRGTPNEADDVSDGGSDLDSSPKKRKTRSRAKTGSTKKIRSSAVDWASKELLDVVVHMRRGDKSFLPQSEVHKLLLDYIKRYNLRDPRRKSQVICDSRLQNLFGKSHVGHFEMLNLLESHFLKDEKHQADDNIQTSVVDTEESNPVDVDEDSDHPAKNVKDKKRKTRKKGVRKGRQSNLGDFAAIDMHNINLIYLRRSLVEDLLDDHTAFQDKVASAFVRLRIPGSIKQEIYRLVQVTGTSKAPEPYKVGKKTTDFVLEVLNLDKTEVISIDGISNQDFTEDECQRLRQSIKLGLINTLTVGDIQEKAIALQEVRVKNLLDAEILRYGHLRDRASDMGRRKELRECVEKLQLLKSPEERQRRLEEIPEIHSDPKMDPTCKSDDEEEEKEKEEKEKEKQLKSRSSSFNRRGREAISPRKGGVNSNESWTSTSNYSTTSANRELSRNYSGRADYLGSSDDKASESLWTSGRDKEMQQQSLVSEKPRSVTLPETATRSSRSVVPLELSPRIASEVPAPPPSVVSQPVPKPNESEKIWHYKDPSGKVQGPFSMAQLRKWNNTGYFPAKLEIWKANESSLDSILLTDALAGLFQKLVDNNSFTKAYSGQSSQSEPNLGSSARTAPSTIEIPKSSQDTWSSGGSLPSPTPNRTPTLTAKRRNFESRWSPTKPSTQSAVQSMNYPASDSHNTANVNHSTVLPSPTPVGGQQSWGSMQTDKFNSHGLGGNDAPISYGTAAPNVLLSQSQPGFPQSDSWRVPAQSQPNTQAQVQVQVQVQAPGNNLQWGMNMVNNNQNPGQAQAPPANQNSSWGQGTVNSNMGWAGHPQTGMNVNWTGGSSVPPTGQAMPNPGWGGPVQGQPQAYPNPGGWGAQPQSQGQQVQAPGGTTGWMQQPVQGMQSGNSNQNWASHNQTAIPSGGSGGNQAGYWGNQGNQQNQNQNGDSAYGWNNRQQQQQASGGQNNFKGQRVCKFFLNNGYCKKGAACGFLHN